MPDDLRDPPNPCQALAIVRRTIKQVEADLAKLRDREAMLAKSCEEYKRRPPRSPRNQ